MKPLWLIEADVFGAAADPLKAEVRRQGMAWHLVRPPPAVADPRQLVGAPPLPDGACVIVYGSLPLFLHVRLRCPGWVPGGWCDTDNLDCGAYYPYFARHLLNQRHEILSGVEAIRQRDRLFDTFGRGGEVFVRPAGVHKLFTGRRVGPGEWAHALAAARYDPATRVVVAEPRTLGREWRLVVAGDRVVAASRYYTRGARDIAAGCPAEVRAFAEAVLADVGWRPDPLFMMDVCEADGGLSVLELNSFSCSGLYACDPAPVIAAAAEEATSAWSARGR